MLTVTDDLLKVKVSICAVCNQHVRAAIKSQMSNADKMQFLTEVFNHDLYIETMTLKEFREKNLKICKCNEG